MNQHLDRETLAGLLQAGDIEALSFSDLVRLVREEISDFFPDGVYQVDPRNGDRILYHSSRARRPHDNVPPPSETPERVCDICRGNTTAVVDVANLSAGFTFINENLYPILYPFEAGSAGRSGIRGQTAYGFHFVQWTSSLHDEDWHNMPLVDCAIVMQRLAVLEKKLLSGGAGFVVIIKNYGRLVGGSLTHGHQQILLSSVMPRRFQDDQRFEKEHRETFSAYMLRENPSDLTIQDYGPAVLLVPYFMRRPYDMLLLVKDSAKKHLHELDEAEIAAVAAGWHDAIRAIRAIMPATGRETAYNVITHNGPGAGLYFEFLPYTQEMGGMEHLGLFICQENPQSAANRIRGYLSETKE